MNMCVCVRLGSNVHERTRWCIDVWLNMRQSFDVTCIRAILRKLVDYTPEARTVHKMQ